MVPVHVPEHLVLPEEERLQRAQPLLVDSHLAAAGRRVAHQYERMDQPVDVHLAVRNPTEHRITVEVLDFVEIETPRD